MFQNNFVVTNTFRFIVFVVLQVLILNHINFLGYINPYIYIIFILLFPFAGNKSLLLFLSFLLGLTIDMFCDSGGIHAAASVTIAFLRPLALRFSFGVSYEHNNIKLYKTPLNERLRYITLLVLIHHFILFSLEIFSIQNIILILKSTLFSSIFSILLITCILMLFGRSDSK
ncbi:rod shape-determining protein MreD [Patiriisocius hiemis]|uniref:Rod shape-determining protein MreD n=1 Tax=Patiriisocius hiemis TaxID=3075604 RepID=A0ABU2YDI5_9FLAO|nr:rod shape-determining protein MreD [Constantimarinum sp. W242]MDT0556252.1 rod shape-determining protein MreD [Constantimarinum sp. W242]